MNTQTTGPTTKLSIVEMVAAAKTLKDESAPEVGVEPKLGSNALLTSVHARLINPETQKETNVEAVTVVVYDWWWSIQFKAGKVRTATV